MPSPTVRYALGQFGYDAQAPTEYGSVVDYFKANATIAKGDALIIATGTVGNVTPCLTNSSLWDFVGFAAEAAATNEIVPVVIYGKAQTVADATVTAGNRLTISATTAAQVAALTDATAVTQYSHVGKCLAIALENGADGDTIDVFVKHF